MRELLLVAGMIVVLVIAGLAVFLPIRGLMEMGAWMVAAGFALGIPTAIVYHVLLHGAMARAGILERGWYWRPTSFHSRVFPSDYRRMRPWFMTGGGGFLIILLGILALLTGMGRGMLG